MGSLERRGFEIRAVPVHEEAFMQDGLPRRFWARVVNYGVVDDYKTLFRPGCFAQSLQRRMPKLMYGHGGWENPLALVGKGVEHRDSAEGLDVLFELDDFDYVPVAKQIAYQLSNDPPTLDELSVGFKRTKDSRGADRGGMWIDEGILAEVSVLPMGSVPNTKILSFRSMKDEEDLGPHVIAVDDAVRILTRFSLGELNLVAALQAVLDDSTASIPDEEEPDADDPDPDDGDTDDGDADTPAPESDEGNPESAVVESAAGETEYVDAEADDILAEVDSVLAGRSTVVEVRRDFSPKERENAAKKGQAMEGGGFPIKNAQDLANAIKAVGRAKDPAAAKAHIIKRARALGLYDQVPEAWTKGEKS